MRGRHPREHDSGPVYDVVRCVQPGGGHVAAEGRRDDRRGRRAVERRVHPGVDSSTPLEDLSAVLVPAERRRTIVLGMNEEVAEGEFGRFTMNGHAVGSELQRVDQHARHGRGMAHRQRDGAGASVPRPRQSVPGDEGQWLARSVREPSGHRDRAEVRVDHRTHPLHATSRAGRC